MSVTLDDTLVRRTIVKLRTASKADAEAGIIADSLTLALQTKFPKELSPEEFARALDELARYHDSVAPADRKPISDYATSRAGIYDEGYSSGPDSYAAEQGQATPGR